MSRFVKSIFHRHGKPNQEPVEPPPGMADFDLDDDDDEWTVIYSNEDDTKDSDGKAKKVSRDNFTILSLLGKGAFGKVVQVQEKSTGNKYAMKVISKQNVLDHGRIQDLFSERSVLRRSNHPFIVKLLYTFQSEHKLFFVMEFLEGGDLDAYLTRVEGRRFSEEQARFYAAQIYLALEYLHQHNIIYRDLKPENILLDHHGNAYLSDFGLSKDFEKDHPGAAMDMADQRANSFVGSPFYVSPDVLRQKKYGKSVDWWSYGVLLFRMLTGTVPFKGSNIRAVFDSIMHNDVDMSPYYWVNQTAKDLIIRLLQKDESKRMTGEAVKNHPFFKETNWEEIYNKVQNPPGYTPSQPKAHKNDANIKDEVARSPPTALQQGNVFQGFSYQNSVMPGTEEAPVSGGDPGE